LTTDIDVGPADEFPEGTVRILSVGGRDIGVLRWRDRWFALRNICPHLGGPVCSGPVQAYLTEDSAWSKDLTIDVDRPVLTCPWHHWQFDLNTGESVTGRERVKTYLVEISNGRVTVHIEPAVAR
jgi:nitrite reductase/ring-hydroxylating ferredoxin subunit